MKAVLAMLLLTLSVFAQSKTTGTAVSPGCGPTNVTFKVKTDKRQHPVTEPDAGKALVYFLQDDAAFVPRPRPTTRVGLDGSWVGATHADSYFYFPVEPGEHHLCANWQDAVTWGKSRSTAAVHFTAEAGHVYYFRALDVANSYQQPTVEVAEVESDQALTLMSTFSFSTSHRK